MNGDKNRIVGTNIASLVAGIWLLFTPSIFAMAGTGFATSAYVVGIVVIALSLIRIFAPVDSEWASWANGLLGLWLLISPLTLAGLAMGAIWNNILLGLIIIGLAVGGLTHSAMSQGHPKMG